MVSVGGMFGKLSRTFQPRLLFTAARCIVKMVWWLAGSIFTRPIGGSDSRPPGGDGLEDVRLGFLDPIEGGVEIRDVERDDLHLAHVLAALGSRDRLEPAAVPPEDVPPLPGDVTEVVVRGDGVGLGPVLLQGILRERTHLLPRAFTRHG